MPGYDRKQSGRNARVARNAPYEKPTYISRGVRDRSGSFNNTRLFVGNLTYEVKWQDLKDHFKSCGEVVYADVMTENNGRSKGCGIVEYSNAADAREAVNRLNESELLGRTIYVEFDTRAAPPHSGGGSHGGAAPTAPRIDYGHGDNRDSRRNSSGNGSTRLFVGNLTYEVKWQDLKDHFKSCGEVVYADVMTENNGRSKGCGIVEYSNAADAREAVNRLNESELLGRTIYVEFDTRAAPPHSGGGSHGGAAPTAPRIDYGHGQSAGSGKVLPTNRVFFGNLDWSVDWKALKDFLQQYGGSLTHVDVPTGPDGRSKGYGIAEYSNPNDGAEIIRLMGDGETMLSGRKLNVREDREEHSSGSVSGGHAAAGAHGNARVFINNLSFDTRWQDLKDFCRRAGDVIHVDIPVGPDGRSKGYGVVEYASAKDAHKAIVTLSGINLQGRNVFCREYRE